MYVQKMYCTTIVSMVVIGKSVIAVCSQMGQEDLVQN